GVALCYWVIQAGRVPQAGQKHQESPASLPTVAPPVDLKAADEDPADEGWTAAVSPLAASRIPLPRRGRSRTCWPNTPGEAFTSGLWVAAVSAGFAGSIVELVVDLARLVSVIRSADVTWSASAVCSLGAA